MTTARDYVPEKRHTKLTPGVALRVVRELQGLSQSELARRTGIAQSAISAFESGVQEMGIRRVKVLAEALGVHPAVIAFPDYETGSSSARSPIRRATSSRAEERRPAKKRAG
jgi:transcriptional regulator with XRE-family HTH domain